MRPLRMLAPLLGLVVCLHCVSAAEDGHVVRPRGFLVTAYPKEVAVRFAGRHAYPLVHETGEHYYVAVETVNDFIVRLPKSAVEGGRAESREGALLFHEGVELADERAYLVFDPSRTYALLSEGEGAYRVEYELDNTRLRCAVPADRFVKERVRGFDGEASDEPSSRVCVIEFDDGSAGSGFLLMMEDGLYCVTNQHVVAKPSPVRIRLADGSRLEAAGMEFAADRDLARMRIHELRPAFDVVRAPRLEDPIRVLGNSLGAGRITSLRGKVTGIGPIQVETDAKFVSGNSGSPILGEKGEVLGVATLVELFPGHNALAEGTSFEDGRRVGVRLDGGIAWVPVDMGTFRSRNHLILQTDRFIGELPQAFALSLTTEPTIAIPEKSFADGLIRQWLRTRNTRYAQISAKYGDIIRAGLAAGGQRYRYSSGYANTSADFARELLTETKRNWTSMLQRLQSKQRLIRGSTPYPDTSFMKERLDHIGEQLEGAEEVTRTVISQIDHTLGTL